MKILTNKKYEEMISEIYDKRELEEDIELLKSENERLKKKNEKRIEDILKEKKWVILCDENLKVKVYNNGRLEEEVRAVNCEARYNEVPTITIEK